MKTLSLCKAERRPLLIGALSVGLGEPPWDPPEPPLERVLEPADTESVSGVVVADGNDTTPQLFMPPFILAFEWYPATDSGLVLSLALGSGTAANLMQAKLEKTLVYLLVALAPLTLSQECVRAGLLKGFERPVEKRQGIPDQPTAKVGRAISLRLTTENRRITPPHYRL